MTYAPVTLQALAKFWVAQGGVNLGIVGDTAHAAKGYSYHLGRDQLAPTAYSIQTVRDKAGLTNGASAIDLGRLEGTLMKLRTFSKWLVAEARANKPGTRDIREIIYSPDGKTVLRWDRQRGYASAPRGGEADNSHLTHTHISWYRDAEQRDHTTAFRPFFAPLPDTGTEDPMLYSVPGRIKAQFAAETPHYEVPGGKLTGTIKDATLWYDLVAQDDDAPQWYLIDGGGISGLMRWVKASAVKARANVIPEPKPYTVTISGNGKAHTVGTVTLP